MTLYIFDKDGTVCRSKSGQPFINSVKDQELIPGIKEKIDELKAQGHKIAIASNQGGVAWNIMSYATADNIMRHAVNLIGADNYAFCAYHPKGTIKRFARESDWRKPNPGVILSLMERLDTSDVIFVGDRPEDQQAAKNAGVEFVWADDFFGRND